jgi:hypothetical protein
LAGIHRLIDVRIVFSEEFKDHEGSLRPLYKPFYEHFCEPLWGPCRGPRGETAFICLGLGSSSDIPIQVFIAQRHSSTKIRHRLFT